MKIVNVIGGLGNQLFQYAFALSLKQRFPQEEVLLDTSHFGSLFFRRYKGRNLHNGYEMDRFFPHLSLQVASGRQLRKVTRYIPNYVLSRVARRWLKPRPTEVIQPKEEAFLFDPAVFEKEGNAYYEGYWHAISYFIEAQDLIAREFAPGPPNAYNQDMIRKMTDTESVGIHVRRGDYVGNRLVDGICTIAYYEAALRQILACPGKYTFFLFSNDLDWCKEHIVPLLGGAKYVVVSENRGADSTWDMILMTYCRHLVMANSTFSWWGAFLNRQGGRIVAPSPWIRERGECDMYRDSWTVIDTNQL